jgi:hypothetical protein
MPNVCIVCSLLLFYLYVSSSSLWWGETGSNRIFTTNWPVVWAPDDGYGAVGGMRIRRESRNTRRKPIPVPLCLQSPQNLTWDQTRAAEARSRQLTAWAMARPFLKLLPAWIWKYHASISVLPLRYEYTQKICTPVCWNDKGANCS